MQCATFIPVSVCRTPGNVLYSYPTVFEGLHDTHSSLPSLLHFEKNPDYVIMQSFSYFGYVARESHDEFIVIGPVFSVPVTESTVRMFMNSISG